ncbi:helix-turn-helix domain-containing protein [Cytobacillus sp. FJAT-54145]|uniref:Helix-turn-helix domain-containing protein n=1 Tax=Cytobacillus spartinae TaxID=3299023 RepID=A0ABW6K4P8_9BACI
MTELGNRLKEARLAKGMSLDDLQTVTKIQKRYLVGIEEGNYSIMPGSFYVRAFIKQYAEAVNIEPEELFEQYKQEIPSTYNKEEIPEKLSRVQTRKDISGSSSKIFEILPKIIISLFIIGALVLIYYLLQQNAGDEAQDNPVDNNENEQVEYKESDNLADKEDEEETNETTDSETEQTTEEEEATEQEPELPAQQVNVVQSQGKETTFELKADQFVVKLVSTGETWVNMLNGKGYSFFQGMLVKDGQESEKVVDFSKETEAVLVIGNSTNTEIYINDVKLDYAVPPADQVRQDITIRFIPTNE